MAEDRLEIPGLVARAHFVIDPRGAVAIEDEAPVALDANPQIDWGAIQHDHFNRSTKPAFEFPLEGVRLRVECRGRRVREQNSHVDVAIRTLLSPSGRAEQVDSGNSRHATKHVGDVSIEVSNHDVAIIAPAPRAAASRPV